MNAHTHGAIALGVGAPLRISFWKVPRLQIQGRFRQLRRIENDASKNTTAVIQQPDHPIGVLSQARSIFVSIFSTADHHIKPQIGNRTKAIENTNPRIAAKRLARQKRVAMTAKHQGTKLGQIPKSSRKGVDSTSNTQSVDNHRIAARIEARLGQMGIQSSFGNGFNTRLNPRTTEFRSSIIQVQNAHQSALRIIPLVRPSWA